MKKENMELTRDSLYVPIFGYELLREVLIPDLLGKDAPQLLYWAGKSMARKFPLESSDEIISFFQQAGWGTLSINKHDKNVMEFYLQGEFIQTRLQGKQETNFQLEAGFLAQQIQTQNRCITEAFEQQKKKTSTVVFTVKWDRKDPTE